MQETGFFNAVRNVVRKILKDEKFCYVVEGRITKDNGDGSYEVKINNDISTIKVMNSDTYSVNDIVRVLVINNNYSDKQILCKR